MKRKAPIITVSVVMAITILSISLAATGSEQKSAKLLKGTKMSVRLDTILDSRKTKSGEWFMAELVEPVKWGHYTIIPKGSMVYSIVDKVKQPRMNITKASIAIVFDRIETPDGRVIPIHAGIHKDFDVVKALNDAGGAVGEYFGKQALNAATGGALTPLLVADDVRKGQEFMQKDRNVVIPAGSILQIALRAPVTVPLDRLTSQSISESDWEKASAEYRKSQRGRMRKALKKGAAEEWSRAVATPSRQTLDSLKQILQP